MRLLVFLVRVGAVAAGIVALGVVATGGPGGASPGPQQAAAAKPAAKAPRPKPKPPYPPGMVALVAVGDLAPRPGAGLFADVATDLPGDVVLGRLGGRPSASFARRLHAAGFTVLALGGKDARATGEMLQEHGLLPTGVPGAVAVQRVGDVRVGVVGVAAADASALGPLVRAARSKADVVVVSLDGGAKGVARPLAHAAVDAGADVVVGHGAASLRGLEWYRDRLIAYSLGTFTGGAGRQAASAILRVVLRGDGRVESGVLVPVTVSGGRPALDGSEAAHGIVRRLSQSGFGAAGAGVTAAGEITRRDGSRP